MAVIGHFSGPMRVAHGQLDTFTVDVIGGNVWLAFYRVACPLEFSERSLDPTGALRFPWVRFVERYAHSHVSPNV